MVLSHGRKRRVALLGPLRAQREGEEGGEKDLLGRSAPLRQRPRGEREERGKEEERAGTMSALSLSRRPKREGEPRTWAPFFSRKREEDRHPTLPLPCLRRRNRNLSPSYLSQHQKREERGRGGKGRGGVGSPSFFFLACWQKEERKERRKGNSLFFFSLFPPVHHLGEGRGERRREEEKGGLRRQTGSPPLLSVRRRKKKEGRVKEEWGLAPRTALSITFSFRPEQEGSPSRSFFEAYHSPYDPGRHTEWKGKDLTRKPLTQGERSAVVPSRNPQKEKGGGRGHGAITGRHQREREKKKADLPRPRGKMTHHSLSR